MSLVFNASKTSGALAVSTVANCGFVLGINLANFKSSLFRLQMSFKPRRSRRPGNLNTSLSDASSSSTKSSKTCSSISSSTSSLTTAPNFLRVNSRSNASRRFSASSSSTSTSSFLVTLNAWC